MWVLILPQNRMRETPQAPRHEVDGKLLRHIEKGGVHIPSFVRRFRPKCVHMSHPTSLVIRSEHAEYVLECSGGGRRADRTPNGTYVIGVNEGDK